MVGGFWSNVATESIFGVVDAALKGGISWFDTAEAYGRGRSEQNLSAALSKLGVKPGSVVVATKWFPFFRTAHSIGATIDRRISCLGPYPIDLYQIHQPASFSPIPAQMKEMAKLLRAGKIRSIGISNFSARQMEQAHDALAKENIVLASNQGPLQPPGQAHRRATASWKRQKGWGSRSSAYSPLAQGMLTGRFHEDPESIRKVSTGRSSWEG